MSDSVVPNHELQALTQKMLKQVPTAFLTHLNKDHDAILNEHRSRYGRAEYLVGSKLFLATNGDLPRAQDRPRALNGIRGLDQDLWQVHNAWYGQYERHLREWRTTCQMVSSLVLRLKTWQDLRNIFPDHVSRPILQEPQLFGLTRTAPEIYAGHPDATPNYDAERKLREDVWGPRPVSMYNQVAPLVDLYVGYQLL